MTRKATGQTRSLAAMLLAAIITSFGAPALATDDGPWVRNAVREIAKVSPEAPILVLTDLLQDDDLPDHARFQVAASAVIGGADLDRFVATPFRRLVFAEKDLAECPVDHGFSALSRSEIPAEVLLDDVS